ncbi:pentapeptide repeat-containing protein [Lyngbya aestuarii]|uniref:pentapeptide repeat-containing protein n=1 Tax=Lyngbya aestuarii TaxID=118322 RepID=UPI00403E0C0E
MTNKPEPTQSSTPPESLNGANNQHSLNSQSPQSVAENTAEHHLSALPTSDFPKISVNDALITNRLPVAPAILTTLAIMAVGLAIDNFWIGVLGALAALLVSLPIIWPPLQKWLNNFLPSQHREQLFAFIGALVATAGLLKYFGVYKNLGDWLNQAKWDEFGSWAEWVGALGQIMIAVLAVYIAWRQYVISKDLTIQQNLITQQQTIDAYFQGVSDLALDDQGLLEDWPQERAFSEGRTAAILSSVDPIGKAKVLRFLSQSHLLTPLKRDRHLGRPMLDGEGGYQEDRLMGVRVIDLHFMLAGADLGGTDLRWAELSEANMVKANLRRCNLGKTNLSRTILYEANLAGADLREARFFYGSLETATPRSRTKPPNYETGAQTGAVVENANFTGVQRMDEEQHRYCCYWCGEKSRRTIPGGCKDIPNKLGR